MTDTYFVVAHIHYVFVGGSVFTIFAGVYHWFPKMTGKMYNETLGKMSFWIIFVGFNADLHADALARPAGHAPPRRDLRRPLRRRSTQFISGASVLMTSACWSSSTT